MRILLFCILCYRVQTATLHQADGANSYMEGTDTLGIVHNTNLVEDREYHIDVEQDPDFFVVRAATTAAATTTAATTTTQTTTAATTTAATTTAATTTTATTTAATTTAATTTAATTTAATTTAATTTAGTTTAATTTAATTTAATTTAPTTTAATTTAATTTAATTTAATTTAATTTAATTTAATTTAPTTTAATTTAATTTESCSVSTDGTLHTPSVLGTNLPKQTKTILAETGSSETDKCKVKVVVQTNTQGGVDWAAVSTGLHPTKPAKYGRNFAFDIWQHDGVFMRGPQLTNLVPVVFPFGGWNDGFIYVTVEEITEGGWMLKATCGTGVASEPLLTFTYASGIAGAEYVQLTVDTPENWREVCYEI